MKALLILSCLLFAVHPGMAKPDRVFILAGQSNMDGKGDGGKLTESEKERLAAVGNRVLFAYNGATPGPLSLTKANAYNSKTFSIDLSFGPELFFGLGLAEAYPDERFIFIKRSLGGTSLYGCWNPDWSEEKAKITGELKKPKLYHELEADIDKVLAGRPGNSYQFCGMLWVQGEADSGVDKFGPLPAETYAANLTNLVRSIREHTKTPDLPLVLLEVGSPAIRKASQQAAAGLRNATTIPQSWDKNAPNHLPTYGPPIGHYNYEGMKRIGTLFFEAFRKNYPLAGNQGTATD